jgi:hypothetical protein
MRDVLFIVNVLLISFSTLSESEKITKFCSEIIFPMISGVSPIASASAEEVDAILAILNFQLIPSLISIDANHTNGLFSIFEQSAVKYYRVSFFVENFFEFLVVILLFFICLPSKKDNLAS